MSRAGELFTTLVLTLGVATVLYTFSTFMARLVEGDLHGRWLNRRRARMLNELAQHFIICGFGRIGRIIAGEFARQDFPFVIVERNGERVVLGKTENLRELAVAAGDETQVTR